MINDGNFIAVTAIKLSKKISSEVELSGINKINNSYWPRVRAKNRQM